MSDENINTVEDATKEEVQAELERTRVALKKANAEAAERRKKLSALEAREETEVETLQKELTEAKSSLETLTAELRTSKIMSAVQNEASTLGFANPSDAFVLLDISSVEITEEGKVVGFEKELKALAESNRLPMIDAKRTPHIGTPPVSGSRPTQNVDAELKKIRL